MANFKITDLPAATVATGDDLLEITDNPSVSPTSKKLTVNQMANRLLNIRDFRQVGATLDRYYAAAHYVGAPGTFGLTSNMFAMPFVTNRTITLDRIGVVVTTPGAGNVRLGIYDSVSDTDLTPNALVLDAGNVDVSVAQMNLATINQTLLPNILYWFVVAPAVAVTVRSLAPASVIPILGHSIVFSTNSPGAGWLSSGSFPTLPATFPSPTIYAGITGIPLVFFRLSA